MVLAEYSMELVVVQPFSLQLLELKEHEGWLQWQQNALRTHYFQQMAYH